jgi:hypothetical protein
MTVVEEQTACTSAQAPLCKTVLEIHTYGLQVKKDLFILVDLLQQRQPPWLRAQPLRILVFIDDLDRCRPSKVVEAVNLVLGPSGFTVVVGMVSSFWSGIRQPGCSRVKLPDTMLFSLV